MGLFSKGQEAVADNIYATSVKPNLKKDGFEIIDVKFNSIQGQGLTGQMEGFHTLITYR